MAKPDLLNTVEAAELLGIKPSTLRIWRTQSKGPHYQKVGGLVYYKPENVQRWLEAQTRVSTSQKADQRLSA